MGPRTTRLITDKLNMDIGTSLVAIVGILGSCAVPVAVMYMWVHRSGAKKLPEARPFDMALEGRLERIEVAVQAIALETERIAEGQRFTTKLLTAAPERIPSKL